MPSNRAQDEHILKVLELRATGLSATAVAARVGKAQQGVSRICIMIPEADMAAPDPAATPGEYERAYPWR